MLYTDADLPSSADSFAGSSEIQPSDYITRALDLRNAIHLNSVDHQFVQRDLGEVRYVFDTNVVLFFLDPFREFDRVSPFGALDREAAQALALVTAEYLFSRKLLGQGGSAPMISTWHAKEFDGKIASLMQEPNHGRQGIVRLSAAVEHNLHQTITNLMGTAHDHARLRDAIDSSTESLGGAGKDLVQKAFIAQQFNRLMSSNLLRPLHADDLALQMRDLPKAPQADAEAEEALDDLARLKAMHRGADIDTDDERQLEKDHADVRTAYEIIQLNKASLRERRSKPTRYVLVTTDRSLHNAVLDWLGAQGRDEIGFFPIRRILQFAPFLNINDMPNGIANSELYKDIQHAVEAFLTACDVRVSQLPKALPMWEKRAKPKKNNPFEEALREVADQMSRRMSTDPEAQITLDRLAGEWQRLGRESVFLNANLLSRRLKPFAALAAFLSKSKDVTKVVEGFMAETVASVERGHVKFGVHHYLHSEIETAVQHADKGKKRRGMIVLRESFSDLSDNEPLVVFLDKMIYGEDEHRAMRANRIVALLDQSDVALHKVFFISACVAFWSSRWETAESFAKRARQLARISEGVSARYILEIEYLTLVAQRYRTADTQLTPSEWVEQTLERIPRINELRETALKADDPFSAARFDLEHGMILVSAGFSTCLLGTPAADNRARAFIEDGADKIEQVSRFMREREEFRGLSATARRYMTAEMIVGLAGCGLYITLLDSAPHRARRHNWHDLAELASNLIDEAQDIVPDIYLLAPQFLELSREKDQGAFEAKRRDLIGKMAHGEAMTTTKLDAAIMAHMTPRIMNMMVPAQN